MEVTWEHIVEITKYLVLPFAWFLMREMRKLAQYMHAMDLRLNTVETTLGIVAPKPTPPSGFTFRHQE